MPSTKNMSLALVLALTRVNAQTHDTTKRDELQPCTYTEECSEGQTCFPAGWAGGPVAYCRDPISIPSLETTKRDEPQRCYYDDNCPEGQSCNVNATPLGWLGLPVLYCGDSVVTRSPETTKRDEPQRCTIDDDSCPDGQTCVNVTPLGSADFPVYECLDSVTTRSLEARQSCSPECAQDEICDFPLGWTGQPPAPFCIPINFKRDDAQRCSVGHDSCPEGLTCMSVLPVGAVGSPIYECH